MGGNFILKLNNRCNLNCVFCADASSVRKMPDQEQGRVLRELESNRNRFDSLIITGGEPTICKDLIEILNYAKNICRYKHIALVTNGVAFADKKYVDSLVSSGVDSFQISFCSSHESNHNLITGTTNTLPKIVQGIKNAVSSGKEARINLVLHSMNYKELTKTIEFLITLGVSMITISFMNPIGDSAAAGKSKVLVSYSESMPYILDAFNLAKRNCFNQLFIENFPVCVAPKLILNNTDLNKPYENKDYYTNGKTKPKKCSECIHNQECEGVWKAYLDQVASDAELVPSPLSAITPQDKISSFLKPRGELIETISRFFEVEGALLGIKKASIIYVKKGKIEKTTKNLNSKGIHTEQSDFCFIIRDEKTIKSESDDPNGDYSIYLSKDPHYAKRLKHLDYYHQFLKQEPDGMSPEDIFFEISEILGYPRCCSEFLNLSHKSGSYEKMNLETGKEYEGETIYKLLAMENTKESSAFPFFLLNNYSISYPKLMNYFFCSYSCPNSARIAERTLTQFKKQHPSEYDIFCEDIKSPIILFSANRTLHFKNLSFIEGRYHYSDVFPGFGILNSLSNDKRERFNNIFAKFIASDSFELSPEKIILFSKGQPKYVIIRNHAYEGILVNFECRVKPPAAIQSSEKKTEQHILHQKQEKENPVITIGSGCANKCIFCLSPVANPGEKEFHIRNQEIKSRDDLQRFRKAGLEDLTISGCDPFEYKHLVDLVKHAKQIGFRNILLCTHGRQIEKSNTVKKLAEAGVSGFRIPIYGPDASTHDAITRVKGSFDEAVETINEVKKHCQKKSLMIVTLILQQNKEKLLDTIKFIEEFEPWNIGIDVAHLYPGVKDLSFSVPYKDLGKHIMEVVRYKEKKESLPITFNDIPFCVFGVDAPYINMPINAFRKEKPKIKLPMCNSCEVSDKCDGFFKNDLDKWGIGDFKPISSSHQPPSKQQNECGIIIDCGCINNCFFCKAYGAANPEKIKSQEIGIAKDLKEYRKKGYTTIEISGSDPLGYAVLPELVKHIRRIGFTKILLNTHGRQLSDFALAEKLIESGVDIFRIPLYGSNSKIHDEVTGSKGSFDETIKGIRNIKLLKLTNPKLRLTLHTLILNPNKSDIFNIFKFSESLGADNFTIAPLCLANEECHKFYLPYKEMKKHLSQVQDYHSFTMSIFFNDIPYCIFGKYKENIVMTSPPDLGEHSQPPQGVNSGIKNLPTYRVKRKEAFCSGCTFSSKCSGFYTQDIDRYGTENIKPIK